jgi:peroxiredoxin
MPCRHHLGEVAGHVEEFRRVGCEIAVVTQAKPDMLRLFLDRYPQPLTVVCDPERVVYRAFGLERTSWLTFINPAVIWGYLKLMFRGERVRQPYHGEDVRQLGGDFLLDRTGRVVWAFTSADPTARPTVEQILDVLR